MIKYPINMPNISELERKYVLDVLDKGWLSAGGEHTLAFEETFANYLGAKHAIAVQSGTAALHLALKAIGVAPGDYVILPSSSCGGSISSVVQCGAVPIILDVELETYGLSAENLEPAIKKYSPKAVQLVHLYGFPARDTFEIQRLCKKYGVILLEDAAEALGATLLNTKIGSIGDIAIFSIRSEKMIGVGEGGVVITNHSGLYETVLKLSSRSAPFRTGASPYWEKYFYDGEGYNYRLPHILGAIARGQIERFENELLPEKIRAGETFREIFGQNDYWTLQSKIEGAEPVYWLNSICFKSWEKDKIRQLGSFLYDNEIEVRSGFWPLSDMAAFSSESFGLQENSHRLFDSLLVLPSAGSLQKADIKHIYDVVCKFIEKKSK